MRIWSNDTAHRKKNPIYDIFPAVWIYRSARELYTRARCPYLPSLLSELADRCVSGGALVSAFLVFIGGELTKYSRTSTYESSIGRMTWKFSNFNPIAI